MPQHSVDDRIAWAQSTDGLYNVKTGYKVWHNQNTGNLRCIQSGGCSRLWRLSIPNKVKIFVWRLCRDKIPVSIRLRNIGVNLPITCLICITVIEHLLHLFFDCPFAKSYYQAVGLNYEMKEVVSAPQWVLNKLETAKHDEVVKICITLWGILFWRNKKV